MFSEKDFERLWFLYKTEGEPKGVSSNSFHTRHSMTGSRRHRRKA